MGGSLKLPAAAWGDRGASGPAPAARLGSKSERPEGPVPGHRQHEGRWWCLAQGLLTRAWRGDRGALSEALAGVCKAVCTRGYVCVAGSGFIIFRRLLMVHDPDLLERLQPDHPGVLVKVPERPRAWARRARRPPCTAG